MRRVAALLGAALGTAILGLVSPALATTTYVDVDFDRSAWEAAAGGFTVEGFDAAIPQADVLDFASGIQSVASGANDSPNHYVDGELGRFVGTLRTAGSSAPGYLTFVWTFPEPIMAFGADFYSIGGSRQVSVQGTFDSGLEAFDLRALFGADGGVDEGFFGLTSSVPFTSITLIALGSIDSNDAFTIDEVVFDAPEPTHAAWIAIAAIGIASRLRRRGSSSRP